MVADWKAIKRSVLGALSPEEPRLLDMLIAGNSTPLIARTLGQHRSMVWPKIDRLRKRGTAPSDAGD